MILCACVCCEYLLIIDCFQVTYKFLLSCSYISVAYDGTYSSSGYCDCGASYTYMFIHSYLYACMCVRVFVWVWGFLWCSTFMQSARMSPKLANIQPVDGGERKNTGRLEMWNGQAGWWSDVEKIQLENTICNGHMRSDENGSDISFF